MNKKAQVWTIDFIAGLLLFLLVLFVGIKLIMSIEPKTDFSELYDDTTHFSDSLLTRGNPVDWNSTNVIIPGIAEYNKINFTKLEEFKKINYDKTKTLFHLSNEYMFFFSNATAIINISSCIYGYSIETEEDCSFDINSITYNNLAKIDRIVVINSSLVKMTVYAWN